MTLSAALLFVVGLGFLIAGAELLVRGASKLASAVGISPLVIGLTVVAFGTSSPEIAVSVQSSLAGQSDIALGNVVGSNLFNVLFILGISALIAPLAVSRQLIRWDVPIMIGISFLPLLMGIDGMIGRVDGALLTAGLVLYTVWSIRQGRQEVKKEVESSGTRKTPAGIRFVLLQSLLVIVGLGTLVAGSQWLVEGAVLIARAIGVSDLIIGLTIVAAGTSLPEVATSILAAIKGERDIAVGNVVGSNIFNILAVLGLAGLAAPAGVSVHPAVLSFDVPVMIAVAVACLPIFFHESRINRWEGALFLFYYLAYTAYLILDASGHDYLPQFSMVMIQFVVPLTVVTLTVVTVRYLRKGWRVAGPA